MTACDCPHDVRVFGHVWPCPQSERRVPMADQVTALLAAIRRIQEGPCDEKSR